MIDAVLSPDLSSPADEWEEPTREIPRGSVTVTGHLKSPTVTRALEVLLELQRRGQLLGVSIDGDTERGYRFAFRVPADEIEYLEREWPAELDYPSTERRGTDDEDTGVHTLPDPPKEQQK